MNLPLNSCHDSKGRIDYLSTSVDARTFEDQTAKMYTMFLALSFTPEDVTEILRTRTGNGDVIAIFEIQQRTVWDLFFTFAHSAELAGDAILRPTALQLHYLIPVIPLLVVWDGMVSTLLLIPRMRLLVCWMNLNKPLIREFGRVFHPCIR